MTLQKLTVGGESRPLIEWAEIAVVSKKTIRKRLARGWGAVDAVFVPSGESPLRPIVQKRQTRKPAPRVPNPLRPTVGRVRSYPIESLELLRRRVTKLSAEYLAAGGDRMTREEAVRHFHNREVRIKQKIRGLPLAEKLRLAADVCERTDAPREFLLGFANSVASLAVSEISEELAKAKAKS